MTLNHEDSLARSSKVATYRAHDSIQAWNEDAKFSTPFPTLIFLDTSSFHSSSFSFHIPNRMLG